MRVGCFTEKIATVLNYRAKTEKTDLSYHLILVKRILRILVAGSLLAFLVLSNPAIAQASVLSRVVGFFYSPEAYESFVERAPNSQTMALLEASTIIASGGGDISVVGDSFLAPEAGPLGAGYSYVESGHSGNGEITSYVVHRGDTLSGIAKMFGVSTNTVIWANDIKNGIISEGQKLIILPVSGVRYEVKKGDTLASIAKKYKGDIDEIASYNGISFVKNLAIGEEIIIPDGEVVTVAISAKTTSTTSNRARGTNGPSYDGYYIRPLVHYVKTQGLHGYNAIDLAAPLGEPILASAQGTVIISRTGGWNGGYGNYVAISHPNGTQTLYAHNSKNLVKEGDWVERGQMIAVLGSSGNSTGPHVHFEIRGAKNPF